MRKDLDRENMLNKSKHMCNTCISKTKQETHFSLLLYMLSFISSRTRECLYVKINTSTKFSAKSIYFVKGQCRRAIVA